MCGGGGGGRNAHRPGSWGRGMRSHGRIDGSFTGATASWPAASRSAFYGSAQSTSGISMATEAFRPSRAKGLILGTMRLHEIDRTVDQWLGFFATAFRLGVRTIHSSLEYRSEEHTSE